MAFGAEAAGTPCGIDPLHTMAFCAKATGTRCGIDPLHTMAYSAEMTGVLGSERFRDNLGGLVGVMVGVARCSQDAHRRGSAP